MNNYSIESTNLNNNLHPKGFKATLGTCRKSQTNYSSLKNKQAGRSQQLQPPTLTENKRTSPFARTNSGSLVEITKTTPQQTYRATRRLTQPLQKSSATQKSAFLAQKSYLTETESNNLSTCKRKSSSLHSMWSRNCGNNSTTKVSSQNIQESREPLQQTSPTQTAQECFFTDYELLMGTYETPSFLTGAPQQSANSKHGNTSQQPWNLASQYEEISRKRHQTIREGFSETTSYKLKQIHLGHRNLGHYYNLRKQLFVGPCHNNSPTFPLDTI